MAPGLFAFVPLDNATIFWRHSSEEFHNADAALTMFEELRANVDVEIAMRKLPKAAHKPKPAPPPGDAKA